MKIRIRLVEQADFGEWLRLRLSLWPDHVPEELAEELNTLWANQEREPVFVAERPDGRLCGMLEAALHETAPGCTTSPVGYLEGWFVDPELRGQGIGGQLVAATETWAKQMGCQEMASDTTPDYPLSPLAHARLGYEETLVPLHYHKTLVGGQSLPDKNETPVNPNFFATPAEFRAWLEAHHESVKELWVGFYKKGSGKPSITWPESVDEALCFGWIDGLRKSIDDVAYRIRFTPRKSRSTWSAININRVAELTQLGRMHPAGLKAFAERVEDNSVIYSYEQRKLAELDAAAEQQFRANRTAWEFFQAQTPSYRNAAIWWVISAKQETTRQSRLARLIEDSKNGRTLPQLTRPKKQE